MANLSTNAVLLLLLVLQVVWNVNGDTDVEIQHANFLVDDAIKRIPPDVLNKRINLPDFTIKVPSNAFTNRDFTATFRNGLASDFNVVKRYGNCRSVHRNEDGSHRLTCQIDLSDVFIQYDARVQGFSLLRSSKEIQVEGRTRDTIATLVIVQSATSNRTFVEDFLIESLRITYFIPSIGLNAHRRNMFEAALRSKVNFQMRSLLHFHFLEAFNDVVKTMDITSKAVASSAVGETVKHPEREETK